MHPMSSTTARRSTAAVLVGLLLVALNLRLAVTSIAALLTALEKSGDLGGTALVLVPAIPSAVFAVAGFGSARLARAIGVDRAVLLGTAVLTAGLLVRSLGSPWLIVIGTVLATSGLAVANVLLPAVVRGRFPDNLHTVTTAYTTLLAIGSAVAAAGAVPVADWLGTPTRGLAFWAIPAALALLAWGWATLRHPAADDTGVAATERAELIAAEAADPGASPTSGSTGGFPVGTRRLAAYFGFQSLLSYVVMGLLPTIVHDAGVSEATSGVMLSITMAVGIPLTLVVVPLARHRSTARLCFVVASTAGIASLVGLMVAPATATWLWAALMGVCMSIFPMVLALIASMGANAQESARVSALAQSVGYTIATIGPLGAGALHQLTDSWTPVLAALLACQVGQGITGVWLARDVPGERARS